MKSYRIILYLVLIINIAILIFLIFGLKKEDIEIENIDIVSQESSVLDEIVTFNTYVLLSKYEGEINNSYINNRVETFIKETIPMIYKDTYKMNNQEIIKYFNNIYNSDDEEYVEEYSSYDAILDTGITNSNRFIDFVKEIQKLTTDELKCENSVYIRESIIQEENYIKANIHIKYENQEELKFEIKISNYTESEEPLIQFSPVKEGV